jgi:hypothetical protein
MPQPLQTAAELAETRLPGAVDRNAHEAFSAV